MSKQEPRSPRRGSIQEQFVELRGVSGSLLHLNASGTSAYVSVMKLEGINYDLKGKAEQRQLLELYQRLLRAISFPVQLLWQVLPLDLEAYLSPLLPPSQTGTVPAAPDLTDAAQTQSESAFPHTELWEQLAASHVAFLQQVAARRTLLSRHMYLLIRLDAESARERRGGWTAFRREQSRTDLALEQARQVLALRVGEVSRLLEAMGLSVRQLSGAEELIPFYAEALSPQRLRRSPLPSQVIAGIGRPVVCAQEEGVAPPLAKASLFPPFPAEVEPGKAPQASKTRNRRGRKEQEGLEELVDLARVEDLVAPSAIAIAPDLLKIEEQYARVIMVQQLPRVVTAGWLKPLMELAEPLEVSFHLRPLSQAVMVRQLRRRLTEYQSSLLAANRGGQSADPHVKIAEADVARLIEQLASGEERVLSCSMHLLIRARSLRTLEERTQRMLSALHSLLLVARIPYFEQEQGLRSLLPHGRNVLGTGILLDSRAASTMFPFLSSTPFHPDGILEGITPAGDPVVLDPWHQELPNANRVIFGPPGWGKSYRVKTALIRMALKYTLPRVRAATREAQGTQIARSNPAFQVIVIDPEREYGRVAEALEGQVIRLSPGSAHHLNPFDLPTVAGPSQHGDVLSDHLQDLHALLEIMLADRTPEGGQTLSSTEKGLLDRALFETYRQMGITSDPATHTRPAPLLRDLAAVLESRVCGPDPSGLALRLRRYVTGSLSGLFAGPTNVNLHASVIVFDVHDLETELRPVGLFLVSNFVWKQSFGSRIPRQLIVDEAATLYQYASGARFLEELVRRARKYYLGVTVISQHPLLFRERSIIANCAVQVLLRQDATALDLVGQMFKLSTRELQILRRLSVGEALLLVGEQRVQVRGIASPLEHQLATTNPRELAEQQSSSEQTFTTQASLLPAQTTDEAHEQPSKSVPSASSNPLEVKGGEEATHMQHASLRRLSLQSLKAQEVTGGTWSSHPSTRQEETNEP